MQKASANCACDIPASSRIRRTSTASGRTIVLTGSFTSPRRWARICRALSSRSSMTRSRRGAIVRRSRTESDDQHRPRTARTVCHYGSMASGALTTPSNRIADFTMFKNWTVRALGNQGRVRFRSEFFNVMIIRTSGYRTGFRFRRLDTVVADGPRDREIRSLRTPIRIVQSG